MLFISFFFLLDIFFIYISNVIPFPGFPSENPLSPPVSSAHQHTLLFLVLGIPFHWGTEPSQEQGPLLPLVTDKTILCYKWGLEFHVYSLVVGLVPGSSGGTGWFILLFLLWGCKPLQLLGTFSSSFIRDPVLKEH